MLLLWEMGEMRVREEDSILERCYCTIASTHHPRPGAIEWHINMEEGILITALHVLLLLKMCVMELRREGYELGRCFCTIATTHHHGPGAIKWYINMEEGILSTALHVLMLLKM